MQYVWQHRLWPTGRLKTTAGQSIDILDPGVLNTGAGPDFFNAKITVDGRVWAGNVEIHVRASDWYRHGHQNDHAYDNVILHVVRENDADIPLQGRNIPQIVMRCNPGMPDIYNRLVSPPANILPCADVIARTPELHRLDWLTALAFERLQRKSDDIRKILGQQRGDWFATIYITLARALGFGSNADPMERLARAVPAKIIISVAAQNGAAEAILLGAAGLLNTTHPRDSYEEYLVGEYNFYRKKYNLDNLLTQPLCWQHKTRPQNSPVRRIAYLANLMADPYTLTQKIFTIKHIDDTDNIFSVGEHPYWTYNYTFGHPAALPQQILSRASADLLIINAVAPLLYARAETEGDTRSLDTAVDLLQHIRPENNTIISRFIAAGLRCRDAFTSQALIQLHRAYCTPRKCLYCRWGHRYLAQATAAPN